MTIQSPPSNARLRSRHHIIHKADLEPNPWNPNRMTKAMRQKLVESIHEYGMIDPLTVRWILRGDPDENNGIWQIIDGENRWQVAVDEGIDKFDCIEVQGLTEAQAKKLTIVMNELHGQADPGKLGDLLADILDMTSLDELKVALPYEDGVLAGYLNLDPLPDLAPMPDMTSTGEGTKEAWVERMFRMPKSVGLVVDEAIEKAKDGEDVETWQALERVAADYLAG